MDAADNGSKRLHERHLPPRRVCHCCDGRLKAFSGLHNVRVRLQDEAVVVWPSEHNHGSSQVWCMDVRTKGRGNKVAGARGRFVSREISKRQSRDASAGGSDCSTIERSDPSKQRPNIIQSDRKHCCVLLINAQGSSGASCRLSSSSLLYRENKRENREHTFTHAVCRWGALVCLCVSALAWMRALHTLGAALARLIPSRFAHLARCLPT